MLQDAVISEIHKICRPNVLHFLEIREMSGIFSNMANLYRYLGYITLCLSAVHLLNESLADKINLKKATHAQQWMRADCRTCLC